MREQSRLLRRDISRWRNRESHISLAELQAHTPDEILPLYRRAFALFFNWPGVQAKN
jgi:hypothetical protein